MNWRHKTNLYTFSWRLLWLPAVLRMNLDKSYTWYKEDPLKPTRNNQNHHFLKHREGQHSLLQVKFHIKELNEGEKDRFVVCTEHGYQANFLLQRLQQLLYQWMPALSSHSTCSFSDCTSTQAAIYRTLSCFHPFAFISWHNLSEGMPSTRYTENPPTPPLPWPRRAEVSFILQKSCTVTSNAPKPLFLFLAHRKLTLAEKPDLLCWMCLYMAMNMCSARGALSATLRCQLRFRHQPGCT